MSRDFRGHSPILLVFALASRALMAQVGDGSISGRTADTSGAAIPKASVTLANESTGDTRATVSGSAGVYVFPSLAPGTYRIDAELPGFQRTVRRGIEL